MYVRIFKKQMQKYSNQKSIIEISFLFPFHIYIQMKVAHSTPCVIFRDIHVLWIHKQKDANLLITLNKKT